MIYGPGGGCPEGHEPEPGGEDSADRGDRPAALLPIPSEPFPTSNAPARRIFQLYLIDSGFQAVKQTRPARTEVSPPLRKEILFCFPSP